MERFETWTSDSQTPTRDSYKDETAYSAATPTPTSQCARPRIGWLPQTRMIQPQRT